MLATRPTSIKTPSVGNSYRRWEIKAPAKALAPKAITKVETLLDQQFGWSARVAVATPASALALRATIDADALAVANALAEHDAPDQLGPEMLAFVQGHDTVVAPSQFAAAIAGRAGVAMRSTVMAHSLLDLQQRR